MAADSIVLFILIIKLVYRILSNKKRKIQEVQTLKGKDQTKMTLKKMLIYLFLQQDLGGGKGESTTQ